MKEGRTIFIGDIHGCFEEFMLLLKKIKLQKNDTVYLAGDMINKGPKSFEVIKYLYENKNQFFAVKGNHEIGFLAWLDGDRPKFGCDIYDKLKSQMLDNPHIFSYFKDIPHYIEKDNFILVHAGVMKDNEIKNTNIDIITNIRLLHGEPWYNFYKGSKTVIYGHWVVDGLRIRKNSIGIDTGCVYGEYLTAYILEDNSFIQQRSLKQYEVPKLELLNSKYKNLD